MLYEVITSKAVMGNTFTKFYKMVIEETYLKGCFILKPKIYKDERGCFFESYNKNDFEKSFTLCTDHVIFASSISSF